MKVLKFLKKLFIGILVTIFFVFAISMSIILFKRNKYGVTQFDTTSLIVITNKISSDNYIKGDLVLVDSKDLSKYVLEEELFVYEIDEEDNVNIEIGKVGSVDLDKRRVSFENGKIYDSKYLIGVPTKVISKLGTYYSLITSTLGFLFVILIPCFLIFIYQIYALIVEIKYGGDEN